MYTRSYSRSRDNRNQRYTPPPGYDGTAFSDDSGIKHHAPDRELSFDGQGKKPDDCADDTETVLECEEECDTAAENEKPHDGSKHEETSPAAALIESLRGKIGAEELIILLTMFLISSDGICAEVLILALVLIAGNERES